MIKIIAISILLAGCSDFESPKSRSERLAKTDSGMSFMKMNNGMPCVKYHNKSISCDWDFKRRLANEVE